MHNFTDLNKYCPKDCYHLPPIKQKVAAIAGYKVISFLDLYKGHHQVQMDPTDKEKTTLLTNWSVFTYKKMSFGLKNVEATYQHLVDRVFKDQIGKNV